MERGAREREGINRDFFFHHSVLFIQTKLIFKKLWKLQHIIEKAWEQTGICKRKRMYKVFYQKTVIGDLDNGSLRGCSTAGKGRIVESKRIG